MKTIGFWDILRSHGSPRLKALKVFDHVIGGLVVRLLKRRRSARVRTAPGRLLIIRPGGIGDAVFLLPILWQLKNAGWKVHLLCESRNAAVFTSQAGLCAAVWRYDVWSEFSKVFAGSYDVVVDTEQWHNLSAVVAYFCKAPIKIGFSTRRGRARAFEMRVPYDQRAYELFNFARLFKDFLPVNGRLMVEGSWVLKCSQPRGRGYAVIGLGGAIELRRFTREQVIGMVDEIFDRGWQVVLVGGRDACLMGIMVKEARPFIKDFTGHLTLKETAALIKGARVFVGPDSGLLHVAAAVGTPVCGIFGPGSREKWQPGGEYTAVLSRELKCSPCTHFGYTIPTCGGRFDCIKEHWTIAPVLERIRD